VLIFVAEKEKLNGMWRETHNEGLRNLFFELNIVTDLRILLTHSKELSLYETEENCEKKILIIVVDGPNKILTLYLLIRDLWDRNIIR